MPAKAPDPWEATTAPDLLTSISSLDRLIEETTDRHNLDPITVQVWIGDDIPEADPDDLIELL